jgi:hypothetical protein
MLGKAGARLAVFLGRVPVGASIGQLSSEDLRMGFSLF